MKYTISTSGGERFLPDSPRKAKLSRPRWASKFRFFTHEAPCHGLTDALIGRKMYAVSEATTGLRVGGYHPTRREAIKKAEALLQEKGYRAFVAAIKRGKR